MRRQADHDISQFSINLHHQLTSATHALVNLDHYVANLRALRTLAGHNRALMAIVKANAYGHGAVDCALAAIESGVERFGVARIDEALQLRAAGIEAPVLVIGPPNAAQIEDAVRSSVALTVATDAAVDAVLHAARTTGLRATVHLKVDTGLHRYGALPELAIALAKRLANADGVSFEGLYTHFSSSDETDLAPTRDQIERFTGFVEALRALGVAPPLIHVANSAAIVHGMLANTNVVRVGIASYGLDPSDEVQLDERFRPILSLRSTLSRRFTLRAGESVSYNRTFTATSDLDAADVPIGYADGLERHLSNRGWFVVRGERAPIIGRVCMDQTVVNVPPTAREGDAVIILGDAEQGAMSADEIGRLCGTNNYETVVGITARVPRLYTRGGVPWSWAIPLLGQRGRF